MHEGTNMYRRHRRRRQSTIIASVMWPLCVAAIVTAAVPGSRQSALPPASAVAAYDLIDGIMYPSEPSSTAAQSVNVRHSHNRNNGIGSGSGGGGGAGNSGSSSSSTGSEKITFQPMNIHDDADRQRLMNEFNLTRSDLLSRLEVYAKLNRSSANTTHKPGTEREQQKIDEIKEDIMQSIGRNSNHSPSSVSGQFNRSTSETTVSNLSYYPICSRNDDLSWRESQNTARMHFSSQLITRLTTGTRLDMATLRLYQRPHVRNFSCTEPNDRIFFTVSVMVRHIVNGDVQYTKRDCDTISRTINNGTWLELDVIEVLRHWQKARQRGGAGATQRPMAHDMLLMIDVRDQDRKELNASQYFEPMDCQAYHTPFPWALFEKTAANLSELELPHFPRLDLTLRQYHQHQHQRSSRGRPLYNSYVDRYHRLDQLRVAHQHHSHQQHQSTYDSAADTETATKQLHHSGVSRSSNNRRQRDHQQRHQHQQQQRHQHHHQHQQRQQRQRSQQQYQQQPISAQAALTAGNTANGAERIQSDQLKH